MFSIFLSSYGVALALSAAAAYTDARTGHIPNALSLPPIAIAPLVYWMTGGVRAAGLSILAAFLCGLVPYLMFRAKAAGGGDVKILAAIGAVAGASFGIETQLFGFAIATFFALAVLAYRGQLIKTIGNSMRIFLNMLIPKKYRKSIAVTQLSSMRMGVPFFLGALLSIWIRSGGVFG